MPRLSVLIPVRNAASTVDLAVRSTLRAMPRDAEAVVWDDASDDGTLEALARIDDSRLRVMHAAEPRGPGGALRELAAATDSEFVARMDGDDVCLPWRFGAQLPRLQRGDCDLAFSSAVVFRTRPLRLRPTRPSTIRPSAMPVHLAVTNLLCHPSLTASRAALERTGGYRAVPAEDYDLWLRSTAAGLRLLRQATPVVGYRHHGGQVSAAAGYADRVRADPMLLAAYREMLDAALGIDARDVDPMGAEWRANVLRPALLRRASTFDGPQRRLAERSIRLLPGAAGPRA